MNARKGDEVLMAIGKPSTSTVTKSLVIGVEPFACRVLGSKNAAVPSRPASTWRAPKIQAGWRNCGVPPLYGLAPGASERKKASTKTSGMLTMRRSSWPPPMPQLLPQMYPPSQAAEMSTKPCPGKPPVMKSMPGSPFVGCLHAASGTLSMPFNGEAPSLYWHVRRPAPDSGFPSAASRTSSTEGCHMGFATSKPGPCASLANPGSTEHAAR
mmetsp:Transcript_40751/g.118026  ORF Transcript_40751/g.118026 Transcript_40751/m.118026 type:complete len:212 (+) Transcript_40751:1093-1728(+)